MENKNIILSMRGITKIYSNGFVANKNVDLEIEYGTIHSLVGENGAGKSTLMKILFGIEQPNEGVIEFCGKPVNITSTNDAIKLGIGMVHQHFKLVPSLTVAENIVQGMEPKKGIFFDKKEAIRITEQLSKKFHFDLDANAVVDNISIGKKQKVEILKALYRNVKLLILDEPTAVLTPQETSELFEQLQRLKDEGITIIFISHKLNEIKQICQKLTIMRAGKSMGTYNVNDLSEQEISRLMVGRDVILKIDKSMPSVGSEQLTINDLSFVNEAGKRTLDHVSFNLRKGEILGIAGIEGSGQTELVELITGMRSITPNCGSITLCGKTADDMSIKDRREAGLAYIPEDRISCGVACDINIKENLISSIYDSSNINGKLFFNNSKIDTRVDQNIKDYDIRCTGQQHIVGMLSGGNMQKVVIAREFSTNPIVLIADKPTRGVDVGAIEFIHKKIVEIRDNGCAVLVVSADLNEILELSDKVIVMCQGHITGVFENVSELTEETLGYYMLGLKDQFNNEKEVTNNGEQ